MQLEKHINITKTPSGTIVSFGGQVCLTIHESKYSSEPSFCWTASPVFAKLTYGANSFMDIPFDSGYHSTMAEAVADGLTKLDELKAFYGVVSLPVDTYVGDHEDDAEVVKESAEVEINELSKDALTSYTGAAKKDLAKTKADDQQRDDKEQAVIKRLGGIKPFSQNRYQNHHPFAVSQRPGI